MDVIKLIYVSKYRVLYVDGVGIYRAILKSRIHGIHVRITGNHRECQIVFISFG